nr:MAG TPA: hypothetical protein [Crassvirales sp.]
MNNQTLGYILIAIVSLFLAVSNEMRVSEIHHTHYTLFSSFIATPTRRSKFGKTK